MTQARKVVVVADEVGVYHCISRCVRRAFLCGEDVYSGQNYEHRRAWVCDRVQCLSALFGIEVFAYSVMSNHLHLVLRNRPDRVSQWSDREVAERWCRVCPGKAALESGEPYNANKLKELLNDPAMLEVVRHRLKDLSWFMRCLNEFLARRANREDGCTGRFCARIRPKGTWFRAPSAFGVRARHRFARRTTFPFAKGYGGRVALRGRGSAFLSLRAVVFPFAAQKDGCPVIFPVIFR